MRIVYNDHVVVGVKQFCTLPVDLEISILLRFVQIVMTPLKRVVKGLGDTEKRRVAVDQAPLGEIPKPCSSGR